MMEKLSTKKLFLLASLIFGIFLEQVTLFSLLI